jgi:signal peptidase
MRTSFFQQAKQITKSIAMIISWTLFVLLVLIIGFLVYYLVCTNIYATKGEKFEPMFSLYTIVSPSMEPNINVYDVVLNTRIDDASTIQVGDVITFISTSSISYGMTVTHRVVSITNGTDGLEFTTKGDNNLEADADTAKEANLLGKVVLKVPQLGRLQFFLSTSGGWLLVVIFPALLIIVNDIFKIIKLNKAKKSLNEAETDETNDEKIKLEAFRKEEIKSRLNDKDLKKAKKLEEKLKSKKNNNDENAMFVPVTDFDNVKEDEQEKDEVNFSETIKENKKSKKFNKFGNFKKTDNTKKTRQEVKEQEESFNQNKINIFDETESENIFSDKAINEETKTEDKKEFKIEFPKLKSKK